MKVLTILAALILSSVAMAEGPGDATYSGQGNYKYKCSYVPEWCDNGPEGKVCYGGYMKCQNFGSNTDWIDDEPKGGR